MNTLCGGCCAVEYSPFYGIEKGAVLQEARIFNDPHIDPRRCQQVRSVVGEEPVYLCKADLRLITHLRRRRSSQSCCICSARGRLSPR